MTHPRLVTLLSRKFGAAVARTHLADTPISWRYAGGARLQDQALAALRGQLADIISGAVFVFVGLAACGIAAMRRRSGVRVLVWWGIWSAMYGALRLGDSIAAVARLPHWFQVSVP